MKNPRQWTLTGEAFKRVAPAEADVAKIKAEIENLFEQLHDAEERLFYAVHKELALGQFINFSLEPRESCMVITEMSVCPDCGEPIEENRSIH